KKHFKSQNEENTMYMASVDVHAGLNCICGGFEVDKRSTSLYVDIVENQPPMALYEYSTIKQLSSGQTGKVYNKAYIGKDVAIDNRSNDPNGKKDIDYVIYTFKNSSGQQKNLKFEMLPWIEYREVNADDFSNTSIIYKGANNGNLNMIFTTDEEWEVTIYVQDKDGMSDTYTGTIKPEELSLKPIAVIKDEREYRYPFNEEFNGKQNRVIKLDSNSSKVAIWYEDMNVTIDHSQNMWQIEPLDGQDINSVKFEKDNINKIVSGNILNIRYEVLDTKIMFKEPGRYKIKLQVTDTEGNVSDWSEQTITIHPDLEPTVTANVNPKYYRNASKNAVITFNALVQSSDYDNAKIESITYKFDSNNNGSFSDETPQTSNLTHKDVNIGGIIYRQITLTTNKVGKYQLNIVVKEEFGQETIAKYIENKDYKSVDVSISTEVDNVAPVASLGLQKENSIDVKILTSGLTGTRNQDVTNNLSNLKNWLESENNIKVGDIEVIDIGKTVNGLQTDIKWQKVIIPNINMKAFWYTQDEETGERIMLPSGTYADGWNGIPVPRVYIYKNEYFDKPDGFEIYVASRYITVVKENYFVHRYGLNFVEIGDLYGSSWNRISEDGTEFAAVTDVSIKDFDISFRFEHALRGNSQFSDSLEPHFIQEYLLFNVQDKNNYFAIMHNNINIKKSHRDLWVDYYQEYYDYPYELIQVINGKVRVLHRFNKKDLNDKKISRVVQQGNLLEIFDNTFWGNKVYSSYIDEHKTGGRIGLAGEGFRGGFTDKLKSLRMNISSLTFIENASIHDSIGKLNWKENSDKYIINLVEGTKVEEITNTSQLNKTAAKLQAEEITLINVGVNSVNGTKLKELVTKNQNNGTWIDIGNVYNNFNSAASYIRNKYKGQTIADDYILLGDKILYSENYSDTENDPIFSRDYRYNHYHTYFENNLGTINNNNVWQDSQLDISNKTGKYTLNYRVRDNPLYPDLSIWNAFNNYRKYSNVFSKDIYVHRKPIANFSIDKSFKNNALIKNTLTLKDLTRTYPYKNYPIDGSEDEYYNANVDFTKNEIFMSASGLSMRYDVYSYAAFETEIPSNAIDPSVSYKSYWYRKMKNGSDSKSTNVLEYLKPGTKFEKIFILRGQSRSTEETISNFKIEYYVPNPNVQVKITESSYDIDHKSLSNKGIIEWQWKIVDKNGATTTYNTTNRTAGINWVQNSLSVNQKWADASVQLRVKDMEGAWSDWTEAYIDEGAVLDPDVPDATQRKPVADFTFDKNPMALNSETQKIYDNSYDPEGIGITYAWTVKKAGVALFTGYQKNIDTQLNQEILKNGVGDYEISLQVTNTKGIPSDIVTKNFLVIVYNYAPTTDFNLLSNESPVWNFPKTIGLHTLKIRPSNSFFHEEKTRFNVSVSDANSDNLGFLYNWKLERFAVKDINNISGAAANVYSYTTQLPFTNSFKGQGLPWGAYRITLSVTDRPPIPPYASGDAKIATVTKNYYIVPELSLIGSFENAKSEILVGDTIRLKAKTSKETENVSCTFAGTNYILGKVSEDSNFAYWEKDITIPDSVTESGRYYLNFIGSTTYGGSGSATREIKDSVPIDIVALKLINFRITDIVNHPNISFPQTMEMLKTEIVPYKAGYYVTFRIDSKGKPDNVYGRIDIGNNGSIDQVINLTKVASGDTETWQGRFYTSAYLSAGTIVSIKLDCTKGTVVYDYNLKENWNGRSLITNGSALQDGRVNLTN
ncbi:MAG TPA: hypothetical protein DD434_07955, partial [Bacteroidales bacterium]|nr:hypothetical protein [Bacteroidales bacterium]